MLKYMGWQLLSLAASGRKLVSEVTGFNQNKFLPIEKTSLTPWAENLKTKIPGESWELKIHVKFIVKYIPDMESGQR